MRTFCQARLSFCLTLCIFASVLPAQKMDLFPAGKLPVPLDRHGSAIVGSRLYVFGGRDIKGWSKLAWSAEVDNESKLGPWRREAELPEFRFYIGNAVQVVNNCIYIAGGRTAPQAETSEESTTRAQDALWAGVEKDGHISSWKRSPTYPPPAVSNAGTCARENQLFIVGGTAGDPRNAIHVSDLNAFDGAPGPWRTVGKLPTPLWFHGAAILDDRIYAWGGAASANDKVTNRIVYSAALNAEGSPGEWRTEAPMPFGISASAFCGFNDFLVCAAGRSSDGASTTSIWFSHLKESQAEQWRCVESNLAMRMYHSVALDRLHGWAFANGGQVRPGLSNTEPFVLVDAVQTFQLPQPETSRLSLKLLKEATVSAGTMASFRSPNDAISVGAALKKPVLLFVYSPEMPACNRLWHSMVNTKEFVVLTQNHIVGAADASGNGVEYCYQYTAFKVPCFVLLSPQGKHIATSNNITSLGALKEFLKLYQGQ